MYVTKKIIFCLAPHYYVPEFIQAHYNSSTQTIYWAMF